MGSYLIFFKKMIINKMINSSLFFVAVFWDKIYRLFQFRNHWVKAYFRYLDSVTGIVDVVEVVSTCKLYVAQFDDSGNSMATRDLVNLVVIVENESCRTKELQVRWP